MRFLFPGFLFALSFIAIPVIIHLFNFRKFKRVYFSNVSFLREIQQQTSSSRNLKNLLLLAVRILTIIFLVFAFARPYIPQGEEESNPYQQNAISIYIDNSYSMETLNKEGSLLDEAKRRAREIAAAYNINDKFQLLTNDFEGKHQRLLSYEDFVQAVEDVRISSLNKNLQQVVSRQQEVFSVEPNAAKTIYVISDFQKNISPSQKIKADTSIALRFVRLQANELPNISVDSVWFVSPVHRQNETERLVVQLRNNSDKRAANIPLKVLIDGKPKALGSLNVEPRATSKDTLSFSGLNPGWKRGEVSITDYPVVFDDNFFFTFNVRRGMSVLSIYEQTESPYVRALYTAEPFFNYQSTSTGSIDYSQLSSRPLIVLSGTSAVSAGLAAQLKTYVQNGGSLMIFPSLDEDLTGLRTLTQTLGTDVPQSISNQELKVTAINLQHPVFRGVFSHTPNRLDLPVAKKSVQYGNASRTSKQNILSSPGRPFLSQYSIGKGKVYLSAVQLSEESSNFVRHSVFVPIMYQAAFLSLRDNRLFYTLGKDQFLEFNKITLSANQTLKLKRGTFEAIPDMRSSENGTRLFISDQIKEKGLYQLLRGDSVLSMFAFNDNRLESDLSYLSKDELSRQFSDRKADIFDPGRGSIQNAIKAANNGLQLWKLCLILALVFLGIEVLLTRFYKARESKPRI
ncbi:BatA domain-containing protein [Paradesertivirga mongoliensis]|uniref:BatA domain-containing protein n=1 Tax=Paradesertivirga mongoliensis TaxID=2100740 RepID=A0ABW4ZPL5_9SPHI|nr:BatA domain-containing protein [Pedobacter mongoliensis]